MICCTADSWRLCRTICRPDASVQNARISTDITHMAPLSYTSSTDTEKGIHSMSVELNGKVALITGGTSDVGRATAMLFAQAGTKVVVAGRSASDGEAAVEEIEAAGGTACFVRADLSNAIGFEQLMDKALQAYGRLDVTVDLVE